jgi:hypothetical protein
VVNLDEEGPAWARVMGRLDSMGLAWLRGMQGSSDPEEGRFESKAMHKPDSMVPRILQPGTSVGVQYAMVLRSFLQTQQRDRMCVNRNESFSRSIYSLPAILSNKVCKRVVNSIAPPSRKTRVSFPCFKRPPPCTYCKKKLAIIHINVYPSLTGITVPSM